MSRSKAVSACIMLVLSFFFHPVSGWTHDALSSPVCMTEGETTVRVAFFPMPGFHQTHPVTGEPVGYDVDYLNRISQHTHWKIQYITVNTWDDALQALENGEVDLVSSAQVTEERLERYAYSADAAGRTRAAMITLGTNTHLVFEDFAAFDKLRVGVVSTWIRRKDFLDYAQSRGFRPEVHEFRSTAQMRDALGTGEIDAMVMNIMEAEPSEKRLAEFLPAPFFYIMSKDNTALKQELDEVLGRLRLTNPDLDTMLMRKWYPNFHKIPYSKAELDYIERNPEVPMSVLGNRPPFSQFHEEEQRFEGIVPAVLQQLSKDSGLRFVLSPLPQDAAPRELLTGGKLRAVAGVARFDGQVQDSRVGVSEPFFVSSLVLVGRAEKPFSPDSSSIVVIPKGFSGGRDFLARTFPNFTLREEPGNARACLEALRVGRADYALVNSLGAAPLLHNPRYSGIDVVPGVSTAEQLALMLSCTEDPLLLSILNKSIQRLNDCEIHRITADYSLSNAYSPTLADFFLQYRTPVLVAFPILGFAFMLGFAHLTMQNRAWRLAKTSADTLKSIADSIIGGVITLNPRADCVMTYANSGFWGLVGVTKEPDLTAGDHRFTKYIHTDDIEPFTVALRDNLHRGKPIRLELRLCHSSGKWLPTLLRGSAGIDTHGAPIVYCVLVDITEQHELIECLEIEKERFQVLIEQSNDILFEYDAENQILSCSNRFRLTYGRALKPGGLRELQLHPDDEARLLTLVDETVHSRKNAVIRVRIAEATGRWLWSRVYLACIVRGDKLVRMVGRIENIDPEVQEVQRLEALSKRDPLCGLLNRAAFQTAVEARLAELPVGSRSALFFIDLDNFKAVNDTFGHAEGDKALLDTAGVLIAYFRTADLVARYGGDEFCVFIPDIPMEAATQKAAELIRRLRRVYGADTATPVEITASIGVSIYPSDAAAYEELVRTADTASYRAKMLGKAQFVLYSDVMRT